VARHVSQLLPARPFGTVLAGMLAREWTRRDVMVLGAFAAGGVLAALGTAGLDGVAGADPLSRVARRFDLLALAAAVLAGCVRAAVRIGEDHATGWLAPWFAAYGGRASYALTVTTAVACSACLLLVAGAVPFAAAAAHAGRPDLLHTLPRLLAGGSLLVLALTSHTVLVGLVARTPASTIFLAVATAAAPYLTAVTYLPELGTRLPPLWLRAWLAAAPPMLPARDGTDAAQQLAFAAVVLGAITVISRARAGRRP
jgi:hypothetical protein